MKAHIYLLLTARSPFHFGVRGVGIEATTVVGRADTLWSAFCQELAELAGQAKLEAFIAAYATGQPPLLLTSAFPYAASRPGIAGDDWQPPEHPAVADVIRFYPRPLAYPPGLTDDPDLRRRVKRIAYVSQQVFADWVAGRDLSRHLDSDGIPRTVQDGQCWLAADELAQVEGWTDDETETISLWATGDVPRVTVDRVSSASQVYQAGRVNFQRGGGLWLAAVWAAGWQAIGETVLASLGDSGLGGERSAGHGHFSLAQLGEHVFSDPAPGGLFVNLALYWPPDAGAAQAALGHPAARYAVETRRGYMSSRQVLQPAGWAQSVKAAARRRKAVRLAGEGSLLAASGAGPYGGLADVTPDIFERAGGHRVLRYGYAFPVAYGGVSHG